MWDYFFSEPKVGPRGSLDCSWPGRWQSLWFYAMGVETTRNRYIEGGVGKKEKCIYFLHGRDLKIIVVESKQL